VLPGECEESSLKLSTSPGTQLEYPQTEPASPFLSAAAGKESWVLKV